MWSELEEDVRPGSSLHTQSPCPRRGHRPGPSLPALQPGPNPEPQQPRPRAPHQNQWPLPLALGSRADRGLGAPSTPERGWQVGAGVREGTGTPGFKARGFAENRTSRNIASLARARFQRHKGLLATWENTLRFASIRSPSCRPWWGEGSLEGRGVGWWLGHHQEGIRTSLVYLSRAHTLPGSKGQGQRVGEEGGGVISLSQVPLKISLEFDSLLPPATLTWGKPFTASVST